MGYESGLPASGTITQREHDKVSDYEGQKRVDLWGFDGANWNRAIVDSSGRLQAAITGGSAGVQYTEGDVDTSITGTAVMWEDTGDTMRPVSAVFPLPVNIVAGSSAGVTFDDGDALDTDSQGTLLIGATAIPGTARAIRCNAGGQLDINDGGNSITVDGTVTAGRQASATATLTNVSGSASSVTILASNANRLMAMVYNDSTANLFLKFGATASSTSFTVRLKPQAYFELPVPVYTGIIDGIWDAAAGAARVTELT